MPSLRAARIAALVLVGIMGLVGLAAPVAGTADESPWLKVHRLQVDAPDPETAMARLDQLAGLVGSRFEAVPTFLFGGRILDISEKVLTLDELPAHVYYAYLALYCLVYVVPPALIVLFFSLTLGSRGLSVREARDLKLLSGLLMLGFGLLLLLAPDLLTDLAATLTLFAGAILAWR